MESASDPNLLLVNLVLGAASLVASVTGFGFALVSVPFLVVLLPPAQVVPIVLISWAPIAVALIAQCRRDLNRGRILRLLGGAAFGAPVGVFVLASLATDTMRAVIGGIDHTSGLEAADQSEVAAEVRGMRLAMGDRGWMLGPGCAYPPETPEANVAAVRRAVEAV